MSQRKSESDDTVLVDVNEFRVQEFTIEPPKAEDNPPYSRRLSENLKRFPFTLMYIFRYYHAFNDESLLRISLSPIEDEIHRAKKADKPWQHVPLVTVAATYNTSTTTSGIITSSTAVSESTYNCQQLFYHFGQPLNGLFPQNIVIDNAYAKTLNKILITVDRYPEMRSTNGILTLTPSTKELRAKTAKSENSDELICDVGDAEIKSLNNDFDREGKFFLTSARGYMVRLSLAIAEKQLQAKVDFIAGPNDERLSSNFVCVFYAEIFDEMCPAQNYVSQPIANSLAKSKSFVFPIITYSELFARNLIVDDLMTLKFRIVGV